MARWQNFSIWRGRLPHWRADGVLYYVSLGHRRDLDDEERRATLAALLRANERKWTVRAAAVGPRKTEALASVHTAPHGEAYELNAIVGRAASRAAKEIMRASGERFPPFYAECYDHIVRDDEEARQFLLGIVQTACEGSGPEAQQNYGFCYLAPDIR
jgi:hypothetical protein